MLIFPLFQATYSDCLLNVLFKLHLEAAECLSFTSMFENFVVYERKIKLKGFHFDLYSQKGCEDSCFRAKLLGDKDIAFMWVIAPTAGFFYIDHRGEKIPNYLTLHMNE